MHCLTLPLSLTDSTFLSFPSLGFSPQFTHPSPDIIQAQAEQLQIMKNTSENTFSIAKYSASLLYIIHLCR
jgi:hypothetical protein